MYGNDLKTMIDKMMEIMIGTEREKMMNKMMETKMDTLMDTTMECGIRIKSNPDCEWYGGPIVAS